MATFRWSSDPAFLAWLEKLGVPTKETRRVVIDAEVNHALKVYVELYGDRAAFQDEPPAVMLDAGIVVSGQSALEGVNLDRIAQLEEALRAVLDYVERGKPDDAISRVARKALGR